MGSGGGCVIGGYSDHDPRGTGSFWLSDVNCAGTEEGLYNCSSPGWGTISYLCGTGDYDDAGVICKARYSDHDPRGTGSFWLSDVNCAGTEEGLYNCSSLGWGTISYLCGTGDYDDAGVICKAPGDGAVRLVNTTSPYEGRVEVYYAGEWGRVCDYYWGLNDAKVVCRQLGLAGAHSSFSGWSPRGTDGDGDLRLINTSNAYEGRLEIYYSGRWGRVCDYGWDLTSADVACKQLGFTGAHTRILGTSPRGTGHYWISDLNCQGSESTLGDCSHDGVGIISSYCSESSSDDAGVLCKGPNDGEVRLIGDSQYHGRVEIFYAGDWGRVCKSGWSWNEAKVACRQLGFSLGAELLDILDTEGDFEGGSRYWFYACLPFCVSD
ncbi:scavenger receptor cysteine-rich domain superfamily protein-like [Lingula anatina]|uniref:Scavenger receptor cysteine-rich domain superfamily protein-like n=1 Tax=Lingula anatina TaxID=7574 RepID=A0A1S3JRV8_LINAN|nr:scavenger receptor cysteine-rich domain superfamily protein-like [Lingula anatina]|eukprot:XP_013413095.1 scavenger receptor cysteine-rich domain superfamily protein-like [Lingula anatina]